MPKLIVYLGVLILLVLTALNIHNYLAPQVVLGAETENTATSYWSDLLTKHPNYIPGWIEMGDFQKVRQIDPNYFLQP